MNLHYVYERTAGDSGFAGTWDSASEEVDSTIELVIQPYEVDGLSLVSPAAEMSKNIKFDGNDYPDVGPNVAPGTVSSGHRTNEHLLEITDKFQGKVTDTRQIEISRDLKTLTMSVRMTGESKPKNILVFDRE